ncbi:MAG: lipoprotein [Neisseriaceae bacterium]|nr:hypothetical protein [Neisseriaceae bacterium PsAf]MCV2502878.1 lipoprotein [Neisseriaceae bacterium]MCV2509010.1 lipoprotein [Neisseriaceae bacterium]
MKPSQLFMLILVATLTACGYKGALYLPDENEDNSNFGPIQTGIGLSPNKKTNHKAQQTDQPTPTNNNEESKDD